MKTALDTDILVDLLTADATFGESSKTLVDKHYRLGSLAITEIVYAELAPLFDSRQRLDAALQTLNVETGPVGTDAAFLAGQRWRAYRARGGPRDRIMSDFLIGAHAAETADILLTRDTDFYGTNYPELTVDNGLAS